MVSKADYLAAAKRLHGKSRPNGHILMGEAAHNYIQNRPTQRTFRPLALKRIIVEANEIAERRLRSRPKTKRRMGRR